MTEWNSGGVLWNLNRLVRKEVRDQLRANPVARRSRYSLSHRVLRSVFSIGTFWRFLGAYLLVDMAAINLEGWWHILAPNHFPGWPTAVSVFDLLKSVPSYLITAQVGVLSVISIALALVTLIAQRDEASADVQVYYHESLFFEIAASCLALIAVLCVQLFWPLQFGYHLLGRGGHANLFKIALTSLHAAWLFVNLAGVAHFVSVTFRFVQRRAREHLRESYTANVIVPHEMTERVRETLYSMAGTEAITVEGNRVNPTLFGLEMDDPEKAELIRIFRHPCRVGNVFVRPAHWAIRRWYSRSEKSAGAPFDDRTRPRLWFAPRMGQILSGETVLCYRAGGLPLDRTEKLALLMAFRFKRIRDAD